MRIVQLVVDDRDNPFQMASLSPALTGLPMVVWISERGRRRDVRVQASLTRGCDPRDPDLVRQWIELNREAIIAYWNGDLLTDEVIPLLKPVAAPAS